MKSVSIFTTFFCFTIILTSRYSPSHFSLSGTSPATEISCSARLRASVDKPTQRADEEMMVSWDACVSDSRSLLSFIGLFIWLGLFLHAHLYFIESLDEARGNAGLRGEGGVFCVQEHQQHGRRGPAVDDSGARDVAHVLLHFCKGSSAEFFFVLLLQPLQ